MQGVTSILGISSQRLLGHVLECQDFHVSINHDHEDPLDSDIICRGSEQLLLQASNRSVGPARLGAASGVQLVAAMCGTMGWEGSWEHWAVQPTALPLQISGLPAVEVRPVQCSTHHLMRGSITPAVSLCGLF